jgi:hypothetical protein
MEKFLIHKSNMIKAIETEQETSLTSIFFLSTF